MALGLAQPLTEMSTRNISRWVKGGRCVELTTLPPSCAYCLEIWDSQPPGTLRACPGIALNFTHYYNILEDLRGYFIRHKYLYLYNIIYICNIRGKLSKGKTI
jgi:hypothetical protein